MKVDFKALMGRKSVIFISGMTVGVIVGYGLFTFLKEKELQKAIDECNRMVDESVKQSEIACEALEEARRVLNENEVKKAEGSDLAMTIDEYKKLYSGKECDYNRIHHGRATSDPAEMMSPSEDDDYDGNFGEEDSENDDSDDEDDKSCQSGDENEVDKDEFAGEIRDANYYSENRRPPKLIKEDTFEYDGRDIYDKIDLYYYVHDDTLASEDEEIIDNIEHTVGDCLDKYGFRKNDEAEICVRNFYTMTDYRITKMFAEFGDLVR